MKSDQYGNPIFEENDLFDLIYQGYDIDQISDNILIDNIQNFQKLSSLKFKSIKHEDLSIQDFDNQNQKNWFMPEEYKNMDIEGYLVHVCPKENYQRLIDELVEFRQRNMIDLLRWLKYFVDICRSNNIVWGVGRGSSVSSYVLYLLGVHKINSIKYKLDFKEFMR